MADSTSGVRVRFAPSPTGRAPHRRRPHGHLQLGVRSRQRTATFILRIEDTDPERSTEENTQIISARDALARPRLGRRPRGGRRSWPLPADRALSTPTQAALEQPERARRGLPVLLHEGDSSTPSVTAAENNRRRLFGLRPHLPHASPPKRRRRASMQVSPMCGA